MFDQYHIIFENYKKTYNDNLVDSLFYVIRCMYYVCVCVILLELRSVSFNPAFFKLLSFSFEKIEKKCAPKFSYVESTTIIFTYNLLYTNLFQACDTFFNYMLMYIVTCYKVVQITGTIQVTL